MESKAVRKIRDCDISVFTVSTAASASDRRSLLIIQNLCRSLRKNYTYAEIGSQDGGSLLTHLIDPACTHVTSIDKRPAFQADARARVFDYQGITTARMMANIRPFVAQSALKKLSTFETDASEITPNQIGHKFDLVLIDAEHTNVAVFSDFLSILPMVTDDAIIMFHDANLIIDGFENALRTLRYLAIPHDVHYLPDVIAVIALGRSRTVAVERFAGIAFDPKAFARFAKQGLHESIAQAVAEGAHLVDAA